MCGSVCPASVACFNGACAAAGACDAAVDCTTCQNCAFDGVCRDELQTCALNTDCIDLANCINACPANDPMCPTMCVQLSPNGFDDYVNITDCLFCQECTGSCGIDKVAYGCQASCDNAMNDCNACFTCVTAPGGLCADDLAICQANPECTALSTCLNGCMDQACEAMCAQDHVDGIADYNAIIICLACQECNNSCNMGQACP